MSVVFKKAEELCSHNTNFQSSSVVSLLKSEVVKATSPKGSNAKTDVIVLKFIRLIGTYDKKSAQVVPENIGVPGERWVRKMNARDRKDCIIVSGEENKKVDQSMETSIERRKMQGGKGTYFFMQRSSIKY